MKKFFLSLFTLISIIACAHDFEVDGIYYNIINDHEVEVTTRNYSYSSSYFGTVIIPESVTFNNQIYSVVSIGISSFSNSQGVTSVSIPNSVRIIDRYAFNECSNLNSIEIPNSVEYIGDYAFEGTPWYENKPDGLVYAGLIAYHFKGVMTEETSITIKDGTKGIAASAFQNHPELVQIRIPNSTINIGDNAFYSCTNLKNVSFGDSISYIGMDAFHGCINLTKIRIPKSVSKISYRAFMGCYNMTDFSVEEGNSIYDSRNNCNALIETYSDKLLLGFNKSVIPNSIKSINDLAFYGCSDLTDLIIPKSVDSIGQLAFYGCKALQRIIILGDINYIGAKAFGYDQVLNNLQTLELHGNICDIEQDAFLCRGTPRGVYQIIIGSKVERIENINVNPTSDIYCFNSSPVSILVSTFANYNATLHVLPSSLAAYFTSPIWENFNNIVGDAVQPQSIILSQSELELSLGDQASVTATVTPTNAYPNNVTWTSTNNDIATVSNGIISALSVGECDIIASCFDVQATCHIIVKDTSISLSFDQHEAIVLPNHIINLSVTSSSELMPELTVYSSDPTVAAARVVDNTVRIVGIKEGEAIITVGPTVGTAQSDSCVVTVYTEPGDVNCDGFINISDVTRLIDYLLSGNPEGLKVDNADTNRDSKVNISDVTTLIDYLLSGHWPDVPVTSTDNHEYVDLGLPSGSLWATMTGDNIA